MRLVHSAVLAAYLGAMPAASAQTAADGAALFVQHCAVCHLADGAGQAGLAPALKGEHWAKLGAERAYLATVLVHGLAGAIKVNGQTFVGVMTAFGAQLDDAALAAVATHVRKLQGADAKPYTPEEIKAVRDKPGDQQRTRQMRAQLLGP
jgi:mono/diheme cytochrome c family protein